MPLSFPVVRTLFRLSLRLFCTTLIASVASVSVADSIEMVFINAGTVLVGDDSTLQDEQPSHSVSTSEYFIDVYEVHIWHWEKVATWAEDNGYEFSQDEEPNPTIWKRRKAGPGWYQDRSSLLFPMNMANWYDAVKWCNARSELEGRIPVYYEDANKTVVYRSGEIDLTNENVNWEGSGYRLPTEVEWVRAARGDASTSSQDYSWGNSFLNGAMANYSKSGDPFDDASTPVGYFDGRQDINASENSRGGESTSPSNIVSSFGLYDITGNVSEWCWDWYDAEWYSNSGSGTKNTKGPDIGLLSDARPRRIARGGNFRSYSQADRQGGNSLRIAYREAHLPELGDRARGLALCPCELGRSALDNCDCMETFSQLVLLGLVRVLLSIPTHVGLPWGLWLDLPIWKGFVRQLDLFPETRMVMDEPVFISFFLLLSRFELVRIRFRFTEC